MDKSEKAPFEVENELAQSLGWRPSKDRRRHNAPDANWCMFHKGDEHVWNAGKRWVRAHTVLRDGQQCLEGHKYFTNLEDALHGRYPVSRAY